MSVKKIILSYLGKKLHNIFEKLDEEFFCAATEIRIRANKPLIIISNGNEFFLKESGRVNLSAKITPPYSAIYCPTEQDLQETITLLSNYSLYAFEEEIRSGYITVAGGHRVGLVGRAILENGRMRGLRNISGLNIRISHEIKGCANSVLENIALPRPKHTMIISPPGCGKTTLLRDIARQFSNGVPGKICGQTVGLIDERSEIAGCYRGIAQNDVGIRTDVLDGCRKAEGMLMMLRAMSPSIIAVDELGGTDDIKAVEDIVNAGIYFICTVHGNNLEDIKQKKIFKDLLEKNIFERFITLKAVGLPAEVFDETGRKL